MSYSGRGGVGMVCRGYALLVYCSADQRIILKIDSLNLFRDATKLKAPPADSLASHPTSHQPHQSIYHVCTLKIGVIICLWGTQPQEHTQSRPA